MFELALILAGLIAGIVFQAWRTARCTGQPLSTILRGGGNGEER